MERRDLLKGIAAEAKVQGVSWELARRGANHDVYSLGGLMIPVGRHAEFGTRYAEMVFKECEPKLGKDWWK